MTAIYVITLSLLKAIRALVGVVLLALWYILQFVFYKVIFPMVGNWPPEEPEETPPPPALSTSTYVRFLLYEKVPKNEVDANGVPYQVWGRITNIIFPTTQDDQAYVIWSPLADKAGAAEKVPAWEMFLALYGEGATEILP